MMHQLNNYYTAESIALPDYVELLHNGASWIPEGRRVFKITLTLTNSSFPSGCFIFYALELMLRSVGWLINVQPWRRKPELALPQEYSGEATALYKYSPDTVPPTHVVSYHVATGKPPRPKWRQFPVYFSDNLQLIATRGKKARGTLLVDWHCGNGCSIKTAPLCHYEISGGHIGRAVIWRKCSAGPVLPLWVRPTTNIRLYPSFAAEYPGFQLRKGMNFSSIFWWPL